MNTEYFKVIGSQ